MTTGDIVLTSRNPVSALNAPLTGRDDFVICLSTPLIDNQILLRAAGAASGKDPAMKKLQKQSQSRIKDQKI